MPGSAGLRRDIGEDFAPRRRGITPAVLNNDDEYDGGSGGLRLRFRGGIPRSIIGRSIAGIAALAALGAAIASMWGLRSLLLTNPRLVLASSAAIQITGNSHLSRAQLLTIFGEDVDRNILTVPLAERRAELERLPWVEHATVMRLLPDHFRVAIAERKPVAFVRQGSTIGLVDAHGVLLDMAADEDAPAQPHYSFPVVTGISSTDPVSVRAARMKLYTRFTTDLGDRTKNVSEVDLSNPEDVKALIPDGNSDILVHFGDDSFAHRYELYEKNLPGWRKDFPKMASADMRYERQVVIEMQPGAAIPVSDGSAADATAVKPEVAPVKPAAKPKPVAKAAAKHPAVTAPVASTQEHLQTAFDVPHKAAAKANSKPTQAGPQ
jgi:cell division protein FtsQ